MERPIVHLNGTSREALITAHEEAAEALRLALVALGEVAPNARDYYPAGPGAYGRALREHAARVDRVKSVREELVNLWEGLEGTR